MKQVNKIKEEVVLATVFLVLPSRPFVMILYDETGYRCSR